ncbi:MAG TPA: DUF3592 domain-containing protein [Candidatus Acidoferrum sp.]|nr:DUF3592 domain-containing protein [Candidatus Acidoferrum sp.]
MAIQECPLCHSRVSLAGQLPYCMNCGWNRDAAISGLRASLNALPMAALLTAAFLGFVVFGWHFRDPGQIAIFAGVPFLGITLNYVTMKSRLGKLEALPASPTRVAADSPDSDGSANDGSQSANATEPSAQDQVLLRTSRPREIRMAKRGQFSIAIGLIVVLVFATVIGLHLYSVWARTLSFETFTRKDWLTMGLAALILLIPFGMWRSQKRECDLLENGEIAMARVTRQWSSDRNSSSISYEFKDFQGQTHQAIGFDYTKNLCQGMTVPVFYDRDNPKRQIAYCSTLHEIVT